MPCRSYRSSIDHILYCIILHLCYNLCNSKLPRLYDWSYHFEHVIFQTAASMARCSTWLPCKDRATCFNFGNFFFGFSILDNFGMSYHVLSRFFSQVFAGGSKTGLPRKMPGCCTAVTPTFRPRQCVHSTPRQALRLAGDWRPGTSTTWTILPWPMVALITVDQHEVLAIVPYMVTARRAPCS